MPDAPVPTKPYVLLVEEWPQPTGQYLPNIGYATELRRKGDVVQLNAGEAQRLLEANAVVEESKATAEQKSGKWERPPGTPAFEVVGLANAPNAAVPPSERQPDAGQGAGAPSQPASTAKS
jgi:hypothetical protein